MNEMPSVKQIRSSVLWFCGDLIQLMAETCLGFIPTCQCQEAPNVSFRDRPEMGKARTELSFLSQTFRSLWPFHNFLRIRATNLSGHRLSGDCDLCCHCVLLLRFQTWVGSREAPSLPRNRKFRSRWNFSSKSISEVKRYSDWKYNEFLPLVTLALGGPEKAFQWLLSQLLRYSFCGIRGNEMEGPFLIMQGQKSLFPHWPALHHLFCYSLYFGHLMQSVDSLEKTLMLGEIGGRRRRG